MAAIKRAQFILEEYPQTPATEDALYIMAVAYGELGMTDLREDVEKVIRKISRKVSISQIPAQ